ncbi:hypothetical protein Tel_03080 [Candidatus Tenderia electrophaga]|jgi:hypothetical protein|uniref:Uncharacterized protein n=1 Tax=Candidatus Tenderia electrophaga TaxID=1748243 RepID=A0A0S2TAP0_9GAMM|nr:hypothetical protein Tel_03080 [Candidatus Tenderia electrophaga]
MQIYDEKHNRWIDHRDTAEYRQRKRRLRDYWSVGLLATLPLPPGIQVPLIVLAIFVSLAYLDETPYAQTS